MGRKRDTGKGRQYGSHTPEVREGALPGVVRELEVNKSGEVQTRTVEVRPSTWVVKLLIPDVHLPCVEEARETLMMYSVGVEPRTLERRRYLHGKKVSIVFDTIEEYVAELPENVLCLFAWFLDWTANHRGKMSELPVGFYGQINALKREYPILGRALNVAEKERSARRSERAMERLEEFSEDDSKEVRSSSVRAAEVLSGLRNGSGGGGSEEGSGSTSGNQVIVNINLDNAFLPKRQEVVDAELIP